MAIIFDCQHKFEKRTYLSIIVLHDSRHNIISKLPALFSSVCLSKSNLTREFISNRDFVCSNITEFRALQLYLAIHILIKIILFFHLSHNRIAQKKFTISAPCQLSNTGTSALQIAEAQSSCSSTLYDNRKYANSKHLVIN